ncbi:hypothetical protein BDP27DRAFT_276534 [Rhodocollybia butyracea]|uniref:SET domain-containing protein n=1 Tax=Rhodocollybia butyracea TaxID=206335 RepID=A0A9P5U0I4_9AGAR|nr:hypothetical protein BDP27DRAFT_276534 [Rhodocollybia butyracea]
MSTSSRPRDQSADKGLLLPKVEKNHRHCSPFLSRPTIMKRGFLTTSKAKERINKAVPDSKAPVVPKVIKLSHGVVPEADYKPQFDELEKTLEEYSADTLDYDENVSVFTCIPSRGYDDKPSDIPGGYAECFMTGSLKRKLYSTPGFPRLPLPPTGGKAYCVKALEQPGRKGLGLFTTRLIRAGDLVVDERPMLVVKAFSVVPIAESVAKYTPEQQRQVFLHEWGKLVKVAFDRMPAENKEEFMALANSHEHDGSDELTGRIRTNGIQALEGHYSAICKDISRANHSCGPNTLFSWHPDSFSVQLLAVRDIPPTPKSPSPTAQPSHPPLNALHLSRLTV